MKSTLGIDGGHRALPDIVRDASDTERLEESDRFSERGYEPEELEAFGEAMPNKWRTWKRMVAPDASLSAHVGYGARKNGNALGGLVALIYSNAWDSQGKTQYYFSPREDGSLELQNNYIRYQARIMTNFR